MSRYYTARQGDRQATMAVALTLVSNREQISKECSHLELLTPSGALVPDPSRLEAPFRSRRAPPPEESRKCSKTQQGKADICRCGQCDSGCDFTGKVARCCRADYVDHHQQSDNQCRTLHHFADLWRRRSRDKLEQHRDKIGLCFLCCKLQPYQASRTKQQEAVGASGKVRSCGSRFQ